MIIDCDSHVMPRDAFAHVDAEFVDQVPRLEFDETGLFTDVHFPANPAHFPGTTPLPVAHSSHGLSYLGNSDMDARMRDYEQIGADRHFALPQLTGWWNYLIEPRLASQMAHSWNVSLAGIARRYPEQFLGVALLALQDVPGAIRELDWAVGEGFRAVTLDYVYPVSHHPYGSTLASHHRELRPLFRGDMQRQSQLLVTMIASAVENLDRLELVLSAVRELGRRHAGYGVKETDYDTVETALLLTLAQALGGEFTREVREAWLACYRTLAEVMKTAAREPSRQAKAA